MSNQLESAKWINEINKDYLIKYILSSDDLKEFLLDIKKKSGFNNADALKIWYNYLPNLKMKALS